MSMSRIAHADREHVIDMCSGIVESVARVSVVLPAAFIILPFHVRILLATASTNLCSSERRSRPTERGAPR
jgi:hypothetical protein